MSASMAAAKLLRQRSVNELVSFRHYDTIWSMINR
jgi:hypothetical protein